MNSEKSLLGKIFISYSSKDSKFVKKISERLKKEGYDIWLDAHELIPGDQLAEKISEALSISKVILLIISISSLKSKWLKFELNKATDRMIQGKSRLIPIVIEKTELPAEVKGLLYADFTSSYHHGIKSVLTALQYEVSHKAIYEASFWRKIEVLLKKVFGSTGFISTMGEYKSVDYDVVYLPVKDDKGEEVSVIYEIVSAYSGSESILNENWWYEYSYAMEQAPESFFLIVSERPIGFKGSWTVTSFKSDRVLFKNINSSKVVIVDLSKVKDVENILSLLTIARESLISFAKEKFQDFQQQIA